VGLSFNRVVSLKPMILRLSLVDNRLTFSGCLHSYLTLCETLLSLSLNNGNRFVMHCSVGAFIV